MPFGYPVSLELAGRLVVVIGETAVREGKVEGLLAAGAEDVLVVVDRSTARLESLAELDPRVTVERRAWRAADLDGAFLCVASSDDAGERSSPALVRRGELVFTISTGGASPALAKKLRMHLSATFGEEWAEVLRVLRRVREETMPLLPDIGDRASRWVAALDLTEAAALVRNGRADDLHDRLAERLLGDERVEGGVVYLVGAGPGDPKLITVRGTEVLGLADVVVYDRLASPRLLDLAPANAERIYAGKEPGRPAMRQPEIDALLVERALLGQTVVRLKGGDPFVFGRGGEEALACAKAGVAFVVVPGVTSAIAAPALAGIPVTHRGMAQSFAVVTGSTAHGEEVDLARVATATDTLVVLMAAGKLAETCAELIAAGRPATEPATIVQWAATLEQRTVVGTLEDLPALATAASIGPPATLVVGAVAALANELGSETALLQGSLGA